MVSQKQGSENSYSFNNQYTIDTPHETTYNHIDPESEYVKSTSAIKLKTLINGFNVNDYFGQDELSVSVYSDVTRDMFKCGQYAFRSGDIVDF